MSSAIRFAHLSDWHATTLEGAGSELLQMKRLSGWASWKINRRHFHSKAILAAAMRDVKEQGVDRILVSGDLTHVSLQDEFKMAAEQLAELGSPDEICLIPGNHDCYVPVPASEGWDHWAAYLGGVSSGKFQEALGMPLPEPKVDWLGPSGDESAPRYEDYPRVWFKERMAVIGLCSAIPMPVFRAGGRLGEVQLDRLGSLLQMLGKLGFARVVMLHHPVAHSDESPRRALRDSEALRHILSREGAELVLHGHKHRRRLHWIPGPLGEIPIVGVPSSSEVGSRPDMRAQYHLYEMTPATSDRPVRLEASIRGYDPVSERFVAVEEELLIRDSR